MSFFNDIPQLPADPIFGIPLLFAADHRPDKVNLSVGSYRTAEGHPLVLSTVRKGEILLLEKQQNKEYLPIEGDPTFLYYTNRLLFGEDSPIFQSNRFFSAQSIGGTGALRLGSELLSKLVSKTIFISDPTWPNHRNIFESAGFQVKSYPCFDSHTCSFDYIGMCEAIMNMPPGSTILLHGCCHNPTGADPSPEQWKGLSDLIKQYKLIPFFDIAYQGFGESPERDAHPIRLFVEEGHDLLTAYSFSKNFGLYGERVGFLTIVCAASEEVPKIASQVRRLVRSLYSNPQIHGAGIISTILNSPTLTLEWEEELAHMRERIKGMREALVTALSPQWNADLCEALRKQTGLFSFLGLKPEQAQLLRTERAIYVPSDGRINLANLNQNNIGYVAEALLQTRTNTRSSRLSS